MHRRRAAAAAVALAVAAAACGPKRVATVSTQSSPQALIALLPDPETRTTGRATVVTSAGSVDLAVPRASTEVAAKRKPGDVQTLSELDVTRLFGDALAALPPAPKHFTLYFKFESDELTDDSRALVPDILNAVTATSVPDVVVVGHTDTLGTQRGNLDLGLKRATMVRTFLIAAGLNARMIEVTSHGEGDLLVHTPDETPEARNRRVEISVR
jgi:outer membrane protein OmpA-like peptidoglycan-associated protein